MECAVLLVSTKYVYGLITKFTNTPNYNLLSIPKRRAVITECSFHP